MPGALIFPVGYAPLSNGAVVPGGKLTFSRTGTSTLQNTYSDSALTTPNTNPVVLNSEGYLTTHVYGDPSAFLYRVTFTTSADVQIWQRDDILINAGFRYDRTAAEVSASITPTNYQYPPGNVLRYGADPSGASDSRSAIQSAVTVACVETLTVTRPQVYIPSGTYLLGAAAGADSYDNGILIPLHSGSTNTDPNLSVRIYGDGSSTRLLCNADDMIAIRCSRSMVDIDLLQIDGDGHTGCIGIGIVPESMTQTSTLTNQSNCSVKRVALQNLTDGIKFQPGPDVMGSESGCFNHDLREIYTNFCNRAIWFAASASGASSNRTTRTRIYGGTYVRGNVAIHIERGTEIDLFGVSIELISTTYDVNCPEGTGVPLATPTAIRGEANVANVRLFGGYAEAATKAIVVSTAAGDGSSWQSFGFGHNSVPDSSENVINSYRPGEVVLGRGYDGAGSSNGARVTFDASGAGAEILFDPDGDGSKTIAIYTNGTERARWFNGKFTHQGSLGDIELNALGNDINFTRDSANSITAAAGSSSTITVDRHVTSTASAADIADDGSSVNTSGKHNGKMCWDTTNNRMMRARGSGTTDIWDVIDGSASVTPS